MVLFLIFEDVLKLPIKVQSHWISH